MKIGNLKDIKGYVSHTDTARWKQETATYYNLKAFIPVNLVLMIPVVLITFLLARRVFSNPSALVRWLVGMIVIGTGIFALCVVFFVVMLGFYSSPSRKEPGGPWVDEYERKMTYMVAGKLLGHEPVNAWQIQIGDSLHLLANQEILLLKDYDQYVVVPAAEVRGIRKMTGKEIETMPPSPQHRGFYNLDPHAEVVSMILNEPAHHEWNPIGLGPFEITLNAARPRAIWIARESYYTQPQLSDKDVLSNDDFMRDLMKALHPEDAMPK
jgi:hypothetical protein